MFNTIGFIGGGSMAEALIKGLLETEKLKPDQIKVAEPVKSRSDYLAESYRIEIAPRASAIVEQLDAVIIAVKPQQIGEVLEEIDALVDQQLLISIAAGVPIAYFDTFFGARLYRLIRVMPNTPALVLAGASALCKNQHATAADLECALSLFSAVGSAVLVDEKDMDGVTGLSGSGPAYVFSFIEALIDGGIKTGLSRDAARELAIQTVLGSAKLIGESNEHPAVLRDRVTSPGGTTISGLHVLEECGFHGIVMSAVEAAGNRARELGENA